MEVIQIIAILFAIFAFSRVVLRLRDKSLTSKEFFFWGILWILLVLVAIAPSISIYIAKFLGITSGTGLLVYISIMLIFYLIFRIYVKMENLEQDMTKIVREISIKKKK